MLNTADASFNAPSSQARLDRLHRVFAFAALVLTLFGSKLLFVRVFGSPVPYWDQWDAEADLLYRSYLNASLSFSTLISSHNEHRIFVTRILSLILFEFDGGWDPILQMTVNAALHVVAISLVVIMLQRMLQFRDLLLLVLFAMLVFALPIGWENMLAGFQSQFYLVVIFSVLALAGFASADAFSVRWSISLVGAVAAYFSMASGALTAAAALAVVALQLVFGLRRGTKEITAAGLLLLLSVVMVVGVRRVEYHDIFKAHGAVEFLVALLKCLDFPWSNPLFGIWVNLPLGLYICFVLATRPVRASAHWVVLSLTIWLLAQSLSLAYGRAPNVTSSRYLDLIIFGLPLNFAVLLLARQQTFATRLQSAVLFAALAWLAITASGLIRHATISSVPAVIQKAADGREQQAHVAEYLKTGSIDALAVQSAQQIPYPHRDRLALLLSDPAIRLLLPEAIRPADIDSKDLYARTALKGRFHAVAAGLKIFLLSFAPLMVGFGLAFAFAAAFFARSQSDVAAVREQPD
jgi:hypothetical protein